MNIQVYRLASLLCAVSTLALTAACEEEAPSFAPRGRDAGPRDAGEGDDNSLRDGEIPMSVTGISERAFAKQLAKLDEYGGDFDDPDRLCVGRQSSCAIDASGTAICWGGNIGGQSTVPEGMPKLTTIACNELTTCALDDTGKIWCWGALGEDPLPDGPFERLTGYAQGIHMCGLRENGDVACWRNGITPDSTFFGDFDFRAHNVPPGLQFSSVSAGAAETCGTELNSGEIVCWGDCSSAFNDCDTVKGSFVEVAMGGSHKCARAKDGSVTCWGHGEMKVPVGATCMDLAVGIECGQSAPHPLPDGMRYERLRLGAYHSCAIRSNYTAACWGWELRNLSLPPQNENYSQIVSGYSHSCALRTTGSIRCWGETTNKRTQVPADFLAP
jgi:alpha-tubulin suppressor-like RCC1 family protein